MEPRVGQWLYGQILRVGKDANGRDVLDIAIHDGVCGWCGEQCHCIILTRIELSEGASIVLTDVPWKPIETEGLDPKCIAIVCDTPGNGCYRCTKAFGLVEERVT